tara:strand:- start:6234 stop:6950 length:717 start_codon:yes stop_codon:yes gene_type:complete
MNLTVIIPCFNCSKSINKNFYRIYTKIKKKFKNVEFILIDDGSNDNTKNSLKLIKRKFRNIFIILNKKNYGKSYCIIKGIKKARGRKIMMYDCDIPYYNYLEYFLKKLKNNKLVIINRRSKKNKTIIEKFSIYKFLRFFVGNLISLITRYLLKINIKDTQAGLKGFNNLPELKKTDFVSKKFFLDIEILMFFLKKNIKPYFINVENIIDNQPSSIKIFNLKKNISILKEYFLVIKKFI